MTPPKDHVRSGLSLLELVLALGMMSLLMTPVVGLLKTSHSIWEAYESDHTRLDSLQATTRHLVRHLRDTDQIVSLSPSDSTAGAISARQAAGPTETWWRVGNQVWYRRDGTSGLLADDITELTFVGFEKDGITPTTVPSRVRIVEVTAKVQLDRENHGEKTSRCRVWLRPW